MAVVWAVTSLRPYAEGTRFTIRTDHDALRWLMTLSDISGRLTRWRLRLQEFDFDIVYRPGRVHQVPDALSRLLAIENDTEPLDDDVPSPLDHVLVTTRASRTRAKRASRPGTAGDSDAPAVQGLDNAELRQD